MGGGGLLGRLYKYFVTTKIIVNLSKKFCSPFDHDHLLNYEKTSKNF
jgi:hypothetical protein